MVVEYLLSMVCASLVFSIVCAFVDGKSAAGVLLRTAGGIVLAVTAIQPLANFDFSAAEHFLKDFHLEAEAASAYGQNLAAQEHAQIIKSRTEAYILDKALSCGASLTADVTVGAGDVPYPVAIVLHGSTSEEVRETMTRIIVNDLNIPEDKQTWIGTP